MRSGTLWRWTISVATIVLTCTSIVSAGTFTATVTGTKIRITYTPTTPCNKVVLIQTVKVTASNEDGSMSMPVPYDKIDNLGFLNNDAITDNTVVDHTFCEKDPYYNGDDDPQDGGQQGKKTATETRPSTMSDRPHIDVPIIGKPKVTAMFEVCAYCADTVPGTPLNECMTWVYMNSVANGESVMTTGGTGAGNALAPTASHTAAVAKFNQNHANNTKCPEKESADKVPGPSGQYPRDVDPQLVNPPGSSESAPIPALSPLSISILVLLVMMSSGYLLWRRSRTGRGRLEVQHGS